MRFSIPERLTLEKALIYIIILAVVATLAFVAYLLLSQGTASIQIISPNGGEEWGIGYNYEITWKSKGVNKVGIVLFEGKDPKWIVQDIPANLGKYEWKIYPGQKYGDNYWIAIFEYPWKKDNKIDFSNGAFAIVYPNLASCEGLSATNEWPHVPNDMPNLRKVFITEKSFNGNLGGLDGANRICQSEAVKQGFSGNWHAFLGGESDDDLAIKRLERTSRGTKGIFVEAKPEATLIRGATCHRLLAKNFDNFLNIFSSSSAINSERLSKDFYNDFGNIWLGRIDEESKKSCISISESSGSQKYSLTVTCQNWTIGNELIGDSSSLPTCYTPMGAVVEASALAGLSSEIVNNNFMPYQGKYCSNSQKLICIEE